MPHAPAPESRRAVLLLDGKPGHDRQTLALFELWRAIAPGESRSALIVEVRFRSRAHRALHGLSCLLHLCWRPRRSPATGWPERWLTDRSLAQLERVLEMHGEPEASGNVVFSCGSSIAPLNHALSRHLDVPNVIAMTPGFPFDRWKPTLAIVPRHDRPKMAPRRVVTHLSPSALTTETWSPKNGALDRPCRIAVLIGGATKRSRVDDALLGRLIEAISELLSTHGMRACITSSRRSGKHVERRLVEAFARHASVDALVLASESADPRAVDRMLRGADRIVVTDDSMAMISEAIGSGKPTFVVQLGKRFASDKHRRFCTELARLGAITHCTPGELVRRITNDQASTGAWLTELDRNAIEKAFRRMAIHSATGIHHPHRREMDFSNHLSCITKR